MGTYHEVDSSELAFRIGSDLCFREAQKKQHRFYSNPS